MAFSDATFPHFYQCADHFLNSKGRSSRQIIGIGAWSDDYISKPFMPQELLLRIYAVLRRTYKEDSPLLVLDGCTIDFSRAESIR